MSWVSSIFIGLLTAIVGGFGAALVGLLCVRWFRVSTRAASRGYFVVAMVFCGTAAGLIGGIVCALLMPGGERQFVHGLALACGSMTGLILLATAGCRLAADIPPEINGDDIAKEADTAEQAKFDAIPLNGAIASWLPYTRYGLDEKRLRSAVKIITARPNYVAELSRLMVSSNQEVAVDALRLLELIAQPPSELMQGVTEAGRHLIALLRSLNLTPEGEDAGYFGAVDAAVRFSAWLAAAKTLRRKCGGDFRWQLCEILALSRVREDSYVIQMDIRRAASYTMHEWAGLASLAGNPPTR